MSSLPDPRFEMPELFEYGIKPADNVVVDWENKAARGLVGCFFPTSNTSPNSIHDLAGGTIDALGPLPTGIPYIVTNKGITIECHPSSSASRYRDFNLVTASGKLKNTDSVTVIDICLPQNIQETNGQQFWRGDKTSSNDSCRMGFVNATTLRSSYIDTTPLAQHDATLTLNTVTINDYLPMCFRKNGNLLSTHALQDGVFKSSSETTGGSGTMRDDATNGNPIAIAGWGSIAYVGHKQTLGFFVFNVGLSDGMIESIMRNPYQFLIPA